MPLGEKADTRLHWTEVRQSGEELQDFIQREFAAELADGTMMRQTLNRYRGLHDSFHYRLNQLPPEFVLKIPTKSRFNDRLVAEGKVTPVWPHQASRDDANRYKRDMRRVARAARRAGLG
jgi:hypothetical protein